MNILLPQALTIELSGRKKMDAVKEDMPRIHVTEE